MSDPTKMPQELADRLVCQPDERAHGVADDGTKLEFLLQTPRGNNYLCKLGPRFVTNAAIAVDVEEIWFFLEGSGVFWLKVDNTEHFFDFGPGTSIYVPQGASLQVRNDTDAQVLAHVTTMPPWPGQSAARLTRGPWS
jgi:mannose-6-phosphate isomerase-like protein (cupin superfamily)